MKADLSGAAWRKSTRSGGQENCVEVADGPGGAVGIRDSKNPADPALVFTSRQWDVFVDAVKNGKFNRLQHRTAAGEPPASPALRRRIP